MQSGSMKLKIYVVNFCSYTPNADTSVGAVFVEVYGQTCNHNRLSLGQKAFFLLSLTEHMTQSTFVGAVKPPRRHNRMKILEYNADSRKVLNDDAMI